MDYDFDVALSFSLRSAIFMRVGYTVPLDMILFEWSALMTRRQKDPLRPLTADEQEWLARIGRSQSDPASHVLRARVLLAVAAGASYTAAAQSVGRRSNDAVAQLVARFNREGIEAVVPRHAGGHPEVYSRGERQRILSEARRMPDREADGTASWSLMTLRQALRSAPARLPSISTATIRAMLREAGWTWQRTRSWCDTGKAVRRRKSGRVEVIDPDAAAKKP
jgi:transposase